MSNYNSIVIIAKNIKMDREYRNVTDASEDTIRRLCNDASHQVAMATNFSYVRTSPGQIDVPFSYDDCIKANYVAFQNPVFSNKWFFGWIDDVQVLSNNARRIFFTIDAWTTFFNSIEVTESFVVREHVNDDTIGKHTVDEGLNVGDVICEETDETWNFNDYYIGVMTSYNPDTKKQFAGAIQYNAQVFGKTLFLCTDTQENGLTAIGNLQGLIYQTNVDGHVEDIGDIFIVPKTIIDLLSLSKQSFVSEGKTYIVYALLPSTTNWRTGWNPTKNYSFRGYHPKNNKCYCYPYNYLYATNNSGNNNIYKYELFKNSQYCNFDLEASISVGASIRVVPKNYKGQDTNDDEALPWGKFPTCGWSADSYTNWLTQNAVNIPTRILGIVANAGNSLSGGLQNTVTGAITGKNGAGAITSAGAGAGQIISGMQNTALSVANLIGDFYTASLLPNIEGGTPTGNVLWSAGRNNIVFKKMRCKDENMEIIDNYFTKFGYKINLVKKPNITGRAHWNFIQISDGDMLGYGNIPQTYMDTINAIARRGTTIWHSPDEIGDFSLDNNIV